MKLSDRVVATVALLLSGFAATLVGFLFAWVIRESLRQKEYPSFVMAIIALAGLLYGFKVMLFNKSDEDENS